MKIVLQKVKSFSITYYVYSDYSLYYTPYDNRFKWNIMQNFDCENPSMVDVRLTFNRVALKDEITFT